jgi:t-SNARE complex subunit (syntaxin)
MNDDRVVSLLTEIRDNQREMLERQRAQLDVTLAHVEQAKNQVTESLKLQREAVARARTASRVAIPAILICIAAIVYLALRYLV